MIACADDMTDCLIDNTLLDNLPFDEVGICYLDSTRTSPSLQRSDTTCKGLDPLSSLDLPWFGDVCCSAAVGGGQGTTMQDHEVQITF